MQWHNSTSAANVTMVVASAIVSVIILFVVVSNALVIYVFLTHAKLRDQPANWFLVSLALADFLLGLCIVPLTLAYELLGHWPFGPVLCELWLAADVLFCSASILNICAIGVDRYCALKGPIRYAYNRPPRVVLAMLTGAWVLAFVIAFPPLVGWRPKRDEVASDCRVSEETGYVLYSAVGSFYLPVALMTAMYAKIIQATQLRLRTKRTQIVMLYQTVSREQTPSLDRRNQALLAATPANSDSKSSKDLAFCGASLLAMSLTMTGYLQPTDETKPRRYLDLPLQSRDSLRQFLHEHDRWTLSGAITPTFEANSDISGEDPIATDHTQDLGDEYQRHLCVLRRHLKHSRQKERQATVLLGCILGVFIVCWGPFFVIYLYNALAANNTPDLVFDIFFFLGYCNSALNPAIYAVFNPEFRQLLLRTLHCNQPTQPHHKPMPPTVQLTHLQSSSSKQQTKSNSM